MRGRLTPETRGPMKRSAYLLWVLPIIWYIALFGARVAAQERISVEPSGVVTWAQMEQLVVRSPEVLEQREVPFMPGPPPQEIGEVPGAPGTPAASTAPPPPPAPEPLGPSVSTGFVAFPD